MIAIASNIAEHVTDEELMTRLARRNPEPEALSELYDRYSSVLKALIIRVVHDEAEADDLLQEIFMQIWHQARHYSAHKGKALGWIVTLARRRSIDRLRKRQAYARATERMEQSEEVQPDAWTHNRIENDIVLDDLRDFLNGHIDALPPFQRQAIDLAYFKGMSQREIAAATDTPLGTIKTRLELGLRKLHDAMGGLRGKV